MTADPATRGRAAGRRLEHRADAVPRRRLASTRRSLRTLTRFVAGCGRRRHDHPGRPRRGGQAVRRGARASSSGACSRRPATCRSASASPTRPRTGRSPTPARPAAAGAHSVMLAPPALARPERRRGPRPLPRGRRRRRSARRRPGPSGEQRASRCRSACSATIAERAPNAAGHQARGRAEPAEDRRDCWPPGRTCASWAASARSCCSRSCGAAPSGTMTGFGFPELLVEIVGRYRAGRRGRGPRDVPPDHAAHPLREPAGHQPGDPQVPLPAPRSDRDGPPARARARASTRAPSRTWSSCWPASASPIGCALPADPDRRTYGSARIIPPSTGTMAPVTYDAAGDSRNAPTRPSSSGSP